MIRVSTIIATYNNESTLVQAIESALAQNFDGQEIIVVNDGSTDGTLAILAGYGNKIRVINQPNQGVSRSRRPAAAVASGKYLAFLDADDIWLPGRLELTSAGLERNPQATLAFGDVIPLDEDGSCGAPWVVGRAPSLTDLLARGWRIYPSAVTMRRSTFVACGGFNEHLTNLSDIYLWLRAREHGEFEYVPESLTIYRTIDFARIGDKYGLGRKAFARAVRDRYGRSARPLAADLDRVLASSLLTKAAREVDRGDLISACRATVSAMRLSPIFLLKSGLIPRIFRPQNISRLYRSRHERTI
jgi:glycosyltransferase involved in cell wall biosynthesis